MAGRKPDGPLPPPLFAMEHVSKDKQRSENKSKPLRAVAYGRCSRHTNPKPIGLVRVNGHLVWREHDYPTWGKGRITCDASGVRLCQCKARPIPGERTPRCDCED